LSPHANDLHERQGTRVALAAAATKSMREAYTELTKPGTAARSAFLLAETAKMVE
jgi:hypothetical protein